MSTAPRLARGPVLALLALLLAVGAVPSALASPPLRNRGTTPSSSQLPTPVASAARPPSPAPTALVSTGAPSAPASAAPRARPQPAPPKVATGEVAAPPSSRRPPLLVSELPPRARVRLDDPVLRWLPEILAAHAATGTPPSLIAAVIQVESSGDPNAVSPAGARGLMQIMPPELKARRIPAARWHDPATNIMAGALGLAERRAAAGRWEGAVARYFGIGCDVLGTCTNVYIRRVFARASHYGPIIGDPFRANLDLLPSDWRPPAIDPDPIPVPAPASAPAREPRPARSRAAADRPVTPPSARNRTRDRNRNHDPVAPTEEPPPPRPTEEPTPIVVEPTPTPEESSPPTAEPPVDEPPTATPDRPRRRADDRPAGARERPRNQRRP